MSMRARQAADLHPSAPLWVWDYCLPGTRPPPCCCTGPSVSHFPSLHNPLYFFLFLGCAPEIGVCWGGVALLRTMLLLMHPLCLPNEGQLASGRQTEGGIRVGRGNVPKMSEWDRPLLHLRPLCYHWVLYGCCSIYQYCGGVDLLDC